MVSQRVQAAVVWEGMGHKREDDYSSTTSPLNCEINLDEGGPRFKRVYTNA